MTSSTQIPFDSLIAALLDESKPLAPRYLNRLSDINPAEQAQLEATWAQIPAWRRQALLEDLEDLTTSDLVLSFEAVGQTALHDEEPVVRKLAVHMLREYENPKLIPVYLDQVENDPDAEVRASIASALGSYVYLGELEKIPATTARKIEDRLLAITQGADVPLVRRRALEALGYSSRQEVPALIEKAYQAGQREWLVSALFAMGRSANETWGGKVLRMLDHDAPTVRAEAVVAAGELGLKEAAPQLIRMVDDDDDRVRTAVVWSLSQIGGENVRKLLEDLLDQVEDEDEVEFLEEALENLSFTEDEQFLLFDIDDFEDDQA
ncbi:MAG: HEAT repeat domain-containing protein [Chloroflexota bacterium]